MVWSKISVFQFIITLSKDTVTYESIMAKYTVSEKATSVEDKDAMTSQKDLDEIHTMTYCKPLKINWFLVVLYYILVLCSLGLLLLLSRWFEWLYVRMTHLECPNEEAQMLLIKVSFNIGITLVTNFLECNWSSNCLSHQEIWYWKLQCKLNITN